MVVKQAELVINKERCVITVKENFVYISLDRFYEVGSFRCSLDEWDTMFNIINNLVVKYKEETNYGKDLS